MMHYKPLYGNPMNLGNVDSNSDDADVVISEISDERVGTPVVFQMNEDAWAALVGNIVARFGTPFPVLYADEFDNLPADVQDRIHRNTVSWYEYFDPQDETFKNNLFEALLLDIQTIQVEMDALEDAEIEDEDVEVSEGEALLDVVDAGLSQSLPSQFTEEKIADMRNVLLGAAIQIEGDPELHVSIECVSRAVESFINVAFPDYMPEELIACLYLSCTGQDEAVDAEELSMIKDDSRPDALCSERNKAIILAAFGEAAAEEFQEFCNMDGAGREESWQLVGRNLSTLLGVSNDAFEAYVVDSFDQATADDLAAEGSEILQALIDDVIDRTADEPMSVIQIPRPAQSSGGIEETAAASGLGMLGTTAILGGAAVGLTLLFRRIKNK
jgi:hypothetical protein